MSRDRFSFARHVILLPLLVIGELGLLSTAFLMLIEGNAEFLIFPPVFAVTLVVGGRYWWSKSTRRADSSGMSS